MGESGLRICTVLIYLKAPIEGGETSFPTINLTIPIGINFISKYCPEVY